MKQKCENAERLGELEPRYPELWEAKYEGKVDDDPLEKQKHRLAVVLDDHDPVVQLP